MTSYDFKKKVLPWLIKAGVGFGIGLLIILLTHGWLFEIPFLRNVELLTVDYRFQSKYDPVVAEQVKDRAELMAALPPAAPPSCTATGHRCSRETLAAYDP